MAIMEYGPSNPHGGGFTGLRVEVKKVGGPTFQKYYSFKGVSAAEKKHLWAQARRDEEREKEDARQRSEAHRLYASSRNPLSEVLGISVGVALRKNRSPEIYMAVSGAAADTNAARTLLKFTRSLSRYDYYWFIKSWRESCRALAEYRGYKRTPSRWYQSLPSEQDVASFIESKAPGLEVALSEEAIARGVA
jgi:hypothetical protein